MLTVILIILILPYALGLILGMVNIFLDGVLAVLSNKKVK